MSDANERRWKPALAALDANLLVALDALVYERNVTRAARRLSVTQSAMSQTLARLRRQFDDPILVKVGREMRPSPFALRISGRLHAAISELEAVVRDRPTFDPATANHRFVIASVDYLALLFAPRLQRYFSKAAPHVRLAVHTVDNGPITGRMEDGTVDLYLGVDGGTERALDTQFLHRETLRVVMRPDHPRARAPLSIETYADAAHLHVSPRRESGSLVDRALAEAGHARSVEVEVPYFSLVPALLLGSDLLATVPSRIAHQFAQEHGLAVLDPPMETPPFEICVAWHPTFGSDPALLWLREVVAEIDRALPVR